MSLTPAMIDAMVTAGLTAEQMAAIVKSHLAAQDDALVAKREAAAQRQRKRRSKGEVSRDVTVTSVTTCDGALPPQSPLFLPPTPPNQNPPIPPNSETNVSGVAAPNVIVLADPRADLFDRGTKTLAALTGRPNDKCRNQIGRWLKLANDDAVRVLRVIEDAARNRVADAVPWIEAALRAPKQAAAQTKPQWVLDREKMQRWV